MENKITFCIPSKDNLRYLKSSITSIQQNSSLDNEIIVWVDSSNDGTIEWLKENKITHLINPNPNPQGIAIGYNRCIEAASNDIVCMFHADMFMGKGFDKNLIKHLKPKTVISGTRIEPPLHPNGKEKIIRDFGMYPEDFKEEEFNQFISKIQKSEKDKVTYGIFAPWICYKDEIIEMGMHDQSFHSYHEDSDIFNRFVLNGVKLIQSRDALVYHLTCRGGIYQDGIEQITKDEKFHNMKNNAAKNYLRKWGTWIENDEYQHPIIPPKYDIGFIVKNCNDSLLHALEPWCSTIYIEDKKQVLTFDYFEKEKNNTIYDLSERVKPYDNEKQNEILVRIDGKIFNEEDWKILMQLSEIIKDSGSIGSFQLGNLGIDIIQMNEYQKDLIKIKQ
jgi:GT2 family glycosyltransferase